MYDPWTWTKGGVCGQERVWRAEAGKGGKWDNCNSIINKIYLKEKKTPEKELSHKETANLSDAEFKTMVIRMLTSWIGWIWLQIRGKNEGYAKWNKGKCTGNQQWWEGNQDSNQWCGPEVRKKHSTRTEWRNKNSKIWGEAKEPPGHL